MRPAIAAASLIILSGFAERAVGPALAAEGDIWVVEGQNVNVRSGPSTNTDVLMTINPGEPIVEVASKGDWYFVEFPDRNQQGWVYGPLLIKPSAASEAAAAAPTEAPALVPVEAEEKPADVAASEPAPAEADTDEPASAAEAAPAPAIETDDKPEPAVQTAAVSVDEEPAAVKSFRETVAELNDRAVSVAGINLFSDVRSTGGGGVQVLATETWASVPEAGQSSYMNALFDRWQSMANGLGPLSLQIVDPDGQVMMERTGS